MKRAYLVAGASVKEELLFSLLKKKKRDEKVIAVDAGLEYLDRAGILPDILIGDFDTLENRVLEKYSKMDGVEILRYNPVKNASDLEIAAEICKERGVKELWALGALGGRADHTLANIFLVCKLISEGLCLVLLDASNKIYALEGSLRIEREKQYGKYLSFFPVGGSLPYLTLKGVKYPLEDMRIDKYKNPSLLISNEICEDFAQIEVREGKILVIESRDA
ncbi:MAG: thiamine diphosphokinase [Johnsonella sp.]|nr:thiamine diphosphokinase [Johnsonella sp.]